MTSVEIRVPYQYRDLNQWVIEEQDESVSVASSKNCGLHNLELYKPEDYLNPSFVNQIHVQKEFELEKKQDQVRSKDISSVSKKVTLSTQKASDMKVMSKDI